MTRIWQCSFPVLISFKIGTKTSLEERNMFLDFTCRYSRGHVVPSMDNQQHFCLIQTNITAQNVYVAFERSVTTEDIEDINLTSDVSLIFSMGSYTISNETNTFQLQDPFYRKALDINVNLMNCLSSKRIHKRVEIY